MTGPTGPGAPIPDTEQTLEFRRPSTARRTAAFAGIAAAAVIAVLVIVTLAFRGDSNVLSPEQVAQQLAAVSGSGEPSSVPLGPIYSASDDPSPDSSASPGATGQDDSGSPAVVDTVAATLTLTCDGTRLTHATWSIKPGYRLDDRTQTSTAVTLKIESDVHDDVLVKAYCPDGAPRVQVAAEPDDHGGNDGGGNGGGPGHG